jgi:hypothetical protein
MLALHPVTYKIDIGGGEIIEVDIKTPLAWAVARALGAEAYVRLHKSSFVRRTPL